MTSPVRVGRRLSAACVVLLALSVSACSSDEAPASPSSATPTATATTADESAAVSAAVTRYWNAFIVSQTEPSNDPALFEGIAKGAFVERNLTTAGDYKERGFRRVGRPVIGEPEVAMKKSGARAVVCWDESGWGAEQDGEAVSPPPTTPVSIAMTLKRDTEGWYVVGVERRGERGAC
ncbi:hypothetical protein [Mumia zhuanghuii]|uniref:hypothetical protein n=1 Tax=Mumia zhuanghuii TaxID=2585211 RepID=UPI00362BBFEB